MKDKKIVLLGGKGESTSFVYNSINKRFGIYATLIEDKESKKKFIKRRIKRLGLFTVVGQLLFQILIFKPLLMFSKKRRNEIIKENGLDNSDIPYDSINYVNSVNSEKTIELLKKINPDIIIVNGTRIISNKVLLSVNCKFINTHAGMTPKYRGVHGTYWALINDDLENSGVTVHYVDAGIDTGNIIKQCQVIPTKKDNFSTYPLLQLTKGLNLLNKTIEEYLEGEIIINKGKKMESILWYHPTIWKYLKYRIIKGIK